MQRAFSRRYSRRRGLTLAVVMAVVATVVIMSIAFLQSQSSGQRVAENTQSADYAMQAAEAGLAAALDAMQTPAWSGVTVPVTAQLINDSRGISSYEVTFSQISGDGTIAGAAQASLQVHIRSAGRWLATGSARPIERVVEATVALGPRLPGRASRPGDVASAEDRANDVSGFSSAQNYAVLGTDSSSAIALTPATRISGNAYVGSGLTLFDNLSWNSTQRAALLSGLGTDNGGGPSATLPHPLAGSMTFYTAPNSAQLADLTNRLKIPVTTTTTSLSLPVFDPQHFLKYRIFDGGFQYEAVQIGSSLTSAQNASLHPTESNPLGIFYCSGSLSVGDNVVVNGTLVAGSGVTFGGRGIAITPFDWRDGSGGSFVTDRQLWPILPAVVADGDVTFRSSCQVFIEGAVVASHDAVIETPDYREETALLNYNGNAIATPLGNGVSNVHVTDSLSLLAELTVDTRHAVQFLNGGVWSEWYPVVTANLLSGDFVVRGTVDLPSATACQFRPRRVYHTDILGPVIVKKFRPGNPPAWSSVSSSGWTTKYNDWQNKRNGILGVLLARPNLTFTQSLQEDGFPFGATLRISRPQNVNYALEPPLFSADASSRLAGGGYRWEVTSWTEASP